MPEGQNKKWEKTLSAFFPFIVQKTITKLLENNYDLFKNALLGKVCK